jgi:hypothetical protein
VYERIPFDGEEPTADDPAVPINAVEQAFYFASGRPAAAEQ